MSEEQAVLEQVETKPEATPQETVPVAKNQQPTETEQKAEEKTENEEPRPTRLQKRIDKLTREKYELRGRVETLEKMFAPQQPQATDSYPKREQYQDDVSYFEAMAKHSINKNMPVQPMPVVNVDEVKAVFEDYDEVMEESYSVSVPQVAADAIMASDKSEHLRYFFTKNPEKASALFSLPPMSQIREIGKIEAGIERDIETRKASKTELKKQSKAPAPISPLKPQGATIETDLDKLPMEEFMKRRNAEELKRRGRITTR